MDKDAYFHKTVTFRAWKHSLSFRTSQELFSSHDIDIGTRFLLRSIVEGGYPTFRLIYDLGCGYGPLGLTLKRLYPQSTVYLSDRDALAVEYTRQNAELNGLTGLLDGMPGLNIFASLDYDIVGCHAFDLIVSNIPGKAGEAVIAYLLQEAQFYLAPGGMVAIVVVSPLEATVAKILAATPGAEVILRRARSGHTVFHYRFTGERPARQDAHSAFDLGVYHRKKFTMPLAGLKYEMQTAYGLPEFDSLSYDSELLLKTLKGLKNKDFRRVVVFNPGQGHVPVALFKLLRPASISLVDRDLLALWYSRLNLTLNGCPRDAIRLHAVTGLDFQSKDYVDLIAGVLRDEKKDISLWKLDQAAVYLAPQGTIILSGGSTSITRLVTHVESKGYLKVKTRERWRGYSVLVLEKLDSHPKKR